MHEVDWNSLWKRKMEDVFRTYGAVQDGELNEYDVSVDYDRAAMRKDWAAGRRLLEHIQYDRGSKVLDIGPGPGTLAIPLASQVNSITAIDPSPMMLALLSKNLELRGIDNVNMIQKTWHDVELVKDIPTDFDVVISSFSLMEPDLGSALRKMHMASSGRVHIFWKYSDSDLEVEERRIWQEVMGREYVTSPTSIIIINSLYDMGICANVELFKYSMTFEYPSMKDLLISYKAMNNCITSDPNKDRILMRMLSDYVENEDGVFLFNYPIVASNIWWDVNDFDVLRTPND